MRKFTGNARLVTKCAGHERWPGVHGKLVNQVKETYIPHSCGGHPRLLFSPASRNTGCAYVLYVLILLLKFL
jgi:hypothetical protein